jgi:hypothetical protein
VPPKQLPALGEFATWPRKLEVIDVKNEEKAQVRDGHSKKAILHPRDWKPTFRTMASQWDLQ